MNKIYLLIGLIFILNIFTVAADYNYTYNLTKYSDDENIIDFYNTTDELLLGFFSY